MVIYLQQELPEYQEMMSVKANYIVITEHLGAILEQFYQKLFAFVSAFTARIRNREIDLEFKVCHLHRNVILRCLNKILLLNKMPVDLIANNLGQPTFSSTNWRPKLYGIVWSRLRNFQLGCQERDI